MPTGAAQLAAAAPRRGTPPPPPPVIGPLLLVVTWGLLRLEGKGLREIGVDAPALRLRQFGFGVLAAGAVAALQQVGASAVADVPWRLNQDMSWATAGELSRLVVNGVLFEELVFRGYLLYQAVRRLGVWRASLLDAAAFGVYHWVSYGVLGQPVPMAFVFLYTGAFGLMLALAFATTRSVAAPIGLHLGWNAVAQIAFSTGPYGAALLVPADGSASIEASGWAGAAVGIGLPLAFIVTVSTSLVRTWRRTEAEGTAPPGVSALVGAPN